MVVPLAQRHVIYTVSGKCRCLPCHFLYFAPLPSSIFRDGSTSRVVSMRTAAMVGALCAASVIAEDRISALTFSYLTFTDGAVSTATTTYGSAPGSGSASTAARNQAWSDWSH